MPAASDSQLHILKPYLEGQRPNGQGEWGMHCPLQSHDDSTRSASVNVRSGLWYCNACETGGRISELVEYVEHTYGSTNGNGSVQVVFEDEGEEHAYTSSRADISEEMVESFHSSLLSKRDVRQEFTRRRGLNLDTIKRFQIGWHSRSRAYTIPIRDWSGELANIRYYTLDPPDDRRKIWGTEGRNTPVIYPAEVMLDTDEVIICEGELDALILIQNGLKAVTRTGAADVWKDSWNHHFDDRLVFVCHDMDVKGQRANSKLMRALRDHAREIREIILPYEVTEKHGKDVTDYFMDGYEARDFRDLMEEALAIFRDPDITEKELVDVRVLDSFSADNAGQKLRMRVTITGKRTPPFLLPSVVEYSCNQAAGVKCQICPMNDHNGSAVRNIEPHDPRILEMMGATSQQIKEILRNVMGAQKCGMLTTEAKDFRAVEELYVRPSIDLASTSDGDYTNRRIISVGRHDSLPNNTVEVVGGLYPNPRGQHNEFQAWNLEKTETSIDRYQVTDEGLALMRDFQPARGQRPLQRLGEISTALVQQVTKIYGRREMHALMDLVFHSVIAFELNGKLEQRGWIDALIVGDTRTGKSEAAQKLLDYYAMGQMISCESASFAGIVGGLQQIGTGKEWEVTWGAIPINDRRLVILDEISGLTPEQIAQMSSIRSSGVAELTKIRSERTYARTRLLWLANPRNGRMSDHTYGVQAIRPLIGNNEDVARFDVAMSVRADEVDPEEINKRHLEEGTRSLALRRAAAQELLLWTWSRRSDQVRFEPAAEAEIYRAALDLGGRYVEEPPLVQAANVRIKVARIAAALAARTFSVGGDPEILLVRRVHVQDAVKFLDMIYGMIGFGYAEISREAIQDRKEAFKNIDEARAYLGASRGLVKFLRSSGHFRRQDLEDMLNLTKEEANGIVGTLWKLHLVTRQQANIHPTPILQDLLREMS